jgi:hypothetical protein
MASEIGRVLTIGAVVLAIPAACVGALALYGRALAESEVGLGTLVSPAEARARLEAARARFRAMTPAEHLADARRALTLNYREDTRTGGNLEGAERHLGAIPEGAPEHAEVAGLRAEVQRRRVTLLTLARARVARHVTAHGAVEGVDAARQRAMRAELARDVDGLSPAGLGCVHVDGEANTTLRFDTVLCDQPMLDAIAPPDNAAALRTYGFRRVHCANGRGEIAL